ncbi:MAG: sporulation protein YqfD [Clostridiales bacterium]|nr:sporulation protein YqfD [Clostridiales bacterium]
MSFFSGSVEFKGLGGFQEKFLTELFENKIKCRKLRYKDGYIYGRVNPLYYLFVARTAKKHGFLIRIVKKRGLYFKLNKFRNRYGLVIGMLLFFSVLVWSTNYVWDIDVEGNITIPKERILLEMEEEGIKAGIERGSSKYTEIERKVLLKIPELAWINIHANGSKLIIEVSELAQRQEEGDGVDADSPANIVSTKDAVIISSEVMQGKEIVFKGSGVKKGGILVSGIYADKEGNMLYKHAKANIIGEFNEEVELYIPYKSKELVLGDRDIKKNYLMFLNNNIPLFLFDVDVKEGDFKYNENLSEIDFFGIKTPFKLKQGIYTFYEEIEVLRNDEDIKALLEKQIKDYEENFFSDYEIISEDKTFFPEEEGLKIKASYVLRGDITKTEEIFMVYKK